MAQAAVSSLIVGAILVGQDIAGPAEVFAGVLQDVGRAGVVGTTTPGRIEALRVHDLDDGFRLWLAGETFDPLHSSAEWEVTRILPDVPAPDASRAR